MTDDCEDLEMCECYMIGGPWIAEDPNCPFHGYAAQREREEMESANRSIEDRLQTLEEKMHEAMCRIRELENT